MKLAIAGDSAGEGLAKVLADHLKDRHEVHEISRTDAGPDAFYANLSDRVGSAVIAGEYDRAILVCGTGIGVCISANKVPGIRAALTHDTYSAERAALSNNAQIITMGARVIGLGPGGQYAIHGTNNPRSVGTAASYGCFRMHNSDVIDLYARVRMGTPVVVMP